MFKKILIVLLVVCFLLGMATRKELENVKREAEGTPTEIEEPEFTPGITGAWIQDEIEYFRKKEYVGNRELYGAADLYPPSYIKGEVNRKDFIEYPYGTEAAFKDFILESKINKNKLLLYYKLLISEIYARKGYKFENSTLRDFFNKMPWYKASTGAVKLNGYEEYNFNLIKKQESFVRGLKPLKNLYTKQVIIKARWGNEPGEFALLPLDESHEWITHIVLDNESNIYIADEKNLRINTFSKSGEFLRSIPVPDELIYSYGDTKTSLVEGLGVDKEGNIYLASSSTKAIISSGANGEIVLKIDKEGKQLDKYSFSGAYVYPVVLYSRKNEMYLWGSWGTNNTAAIPLGYGKIGVSAFSRGVISSRSFQSSGNKIVLSDIGIKINNEKAPVSFNISRTSRVVFFDGRVFYFQDEDGEIKAEIDHKYFRYYPLGEGFFYKNIGVMVWADPFIDDDLNIYWVEGTPTHLHVIKYTPTEEAWK
jgi:hypothetical protein